MKPNELRVMLAACRHAQETFKLLACENYPFGDWESQELRNMFYQLNDMCIDLQKLSEAADDAAPVAKVDGRSEL